MALFSASALSRQPQLDFTRSQPVSSVLYQYSASTLQVSNSVSILYLICSKIAQSFQSSTSNFLPSYAITTANNMLRRKPTTITLTTEDVAIYEDTRARENHMREQAALQEQMQAQGTPQNKNQNVRDPNDELRPLPGDRARAQAQQAKSREERLGLMGGGMGSSRS